MFIKISLVLSDIILCNEMNRNLGLFIGKISSDNFGFVVTGRVFTSLLAIALVTVMRIFDIKRYKNLSAPIVIVTLITAAKHIL